MRHRDGPARAVGGWVYVDPDPPGHGARPVGHRVVQVVHTDGVAGEPEGSAGEVCRDPHAGLVGHGAQAERPGAAAGMLQRRDGDLPADRGAHGETVGDDGHTASLSHRDVQGAGSGEAAVRDGEAHLGGVPAVAGIREQHGAGRGGRGGVRCRGRGDGEVERVAVRVDPVAEHLRLDAAASRDDGAGLANLLWGGILVRTADRDGDGGVRRAAAAVAERIAEAEAARGLRGEGELQLLVARDQVDPALAGRRQVGRVDHQDIVVRVVVVQQHRQGDRATGAGTELVVDRDRRHLGVLVVRRGVVGACRRLLLVGDRVDEVVPVVDEFVALLHVPGGAVVGVVEQQPGAVLPVLQAGVACDAGEGCGASGRRADAAGLPGGAVRPGRVGTAPVLAGRGRGAGGSVAGEQFGGRAAVQGHTEQSGAVGDQHPVAGHRRLLQAGQLGQACREVDGPVGQVQDAGGRVQQGPAAVHLAELVAVGGLPGRHARRLGHGAGALRVDTHKSLSGRGEREQHAGGIEAEQGAGAQREGRVHGAVEGGQVGGVRRPEVTVGRDRCEAARQSHLGGIRWQRHAVGERGSGRVEDVEGAVAAVDHEHRAAVLHHRGAPGFDRDDGVQLGELGVDPAHQLPGFAAHPDGGVAQIDLLGGVAAGDHRDGDHECGDQGSAGDGGEDGTACGQPAADHGVPGAGSTHFSVLAAPVRPSRLTLTVMQTGVSVVLPVCTMNSVPR
nr:hypothetical protein BJQ95_02141 [Cryobacterium sp. SO1]